MHKAATLDPPPPTHTRARFPASTLHTWVLLLTWLLGVERMAHCMQCRCWAITHVACVQCSPHIILIDTKQVMEVALLPEQVFPICAVEGQDAATLYTPHSRNVRSMSRWARRQGPGVLLQDCYTSSTRLSQLIMTADEDRPDVEETVSYNVTSYLIDSAYILNSRKIA